MAGPPSCSPPTSPIGNCRRSRRSATALVSAALYRTPNNRAIARDVLRMRSGVMGELIPAGVSAPIRMMEALDEGPASRHAGRPALRARAEIRFLGRPASANPLLARLARRFDCPVHGARAIRLPGNRFRLELTEP
jgi:KDO2-lipid IV(A) lauroyltransferase